MRILMWFSLGFAVSCFLGSLFWMGLWIPAVLLPALCGLGLFFRREKPARAIALMCLGAVLGTGWFCVYDRLYTQPLRELDGQTVNVMLTTVSDSWDTQYGSCVDCQLELDGNTYRIRLYLNEKKTLHPWTAIACPVELRLTTDGGAGAVTFHRSQRILALGYQRAAAEYTPRSDRQEGMWVILQAQLRRNITQVLEDAFTEEEAAFAKALLIGDKTDLSYETSVDFKVSGISHIIAVSGLHMSIVYAMIAFATGKQRYLLTLAGIPAVVLFMVVAGFTPSVTRAGMMMAVMLLSVLCKREYDPPTALSFAALVMLMMNPLVSTSISFQLSVASVAGIFLFMGRISRYLTEWIPAARHRLGKRLRSWLITGVSVTLSAQVLTTPLVAYYYQTVSLVGIVTNLAVLWVITFVFCGVMLLGILGGIFPWAGTVLGGILSVPIRFVLGTARLMAGIPVAAVYTQSVYIVAWLVFVYGLIGLLILGKEKQPGISSGAAAAALVLALVLGWLEPGMSDQCVTVVDVGQGQSVILQHGGKTFLVDCGGDYDDDTADAVAQTLLSMGIRRIDGLIVTHYDRDHTGGIPGLMYRIGVDALYLPRAEGGDAFVQAIPDCEPVWVDRDLQLSADGMELTLFVSKNGTNDNERSIAVLFQTEKCDTLLTGDISGLYEQILIREHEIPDLEILIAGHHGSKNGTSRELLEQCAPDAVVISVGRDNRYGHPAEETLQRLAELGCAVYRTDESGTIVLRR